MANTLLTIDMITKECVRLFHEKATFIGTINRDYDNQYQNGGGKEGATLRIRKPPQYTRRTGSRIMNVQDTLETSVTLTKATQDGVDMHFPSSELAQSLQSFSDNHLQMAMNVLVSGIESDVLIGCTKGTSNLVGTFGTPVGTSSSDISALGAARAKLNQNVAPMNDRSAQLDSITMGNISNATKGLFHQDTQITQMFREGYFTRYAAANWYENERTYSQLYGGDVTATSDSTHLVTDGGTTIDMHTTKTTANQVVGEVFTIAGVYDVHPETKQPYSHLKQFTITALNSPTTDITQISPPTYWTGPRKNISTSTGADLATADFQSKTLTFFGAISTSYRNNLMYQKDAFAFATADLPIMADAARCVRMNKDGISLRVWQGSDIVNDKLYTRVDCLYGYALVNPQWACRITN